MDYRDSVVLNVSYLMTFDENPKILPGAKTAQIDRAASLVEGFLLAKQALDLYEKKGDRKMFIFPLGKLSLTIKTETLQAA